MSKNASTKRSVEREGEREREREGGRERERRRGRERCASSPKK
jgi:hypothetical protein